MKNVSKVFLVLVILITTNMYAQTSNDFTVVDEIADNVQNLQNKYKSNSNAFFTNGIEKNAVYQITEQLQSKSLENLHLYVAAKPGSIVFNSIALNIDNIDMYSNLLQTWSLFIHGTVFIHNPDVFNGEDGLTFKTKLETLTGLSFQATK
ncbi:MAG: DUF4347 domain-containing protein [Bacteroidales bacterium]|nr:DUF4347 domain-containing protein [Bacteroidales bacterium]